MNKTKINFEKHYCMVFLIFGAIMPFIATNDVFASAYSLSVSKG